VNMTVSLCNCWKCIFQQWKFHCGFDLCFHCVFPLHSSSAAVICNHLFDVLSEHLLSGKKEKRAEGQLERVFPFDSTITTRFHVDGSNLMKHLTILCRVLMVRNNAVCSVHNVALLHLTHRKAHRVCVECA